ncbi:MAG: FkbM family methyltransferase, partial [Candidatus Neomarinimicrobiota bacterium]
MGIQEIEIAKYVKRLVEKDFTCFDIGSAYGYYTLALARLTRMGKVIAFEPQDELFELLELTIKRNSNLPITFELHNTRIGAESSGMTTSLDDFVVRDEDRVPDFIKIDVDGAESEILQGSRVVIQRFRPRFVIEVHSYELEEDCVQLLNEYGYVCRIVNQQMIWPELRPIELNRWVIATHKRDE